MKRNNQNKGRNIFTLITFLLLVTCFIMSIKKDEEDTLTKETDVASAQTIAETTIEIREAKVSTVGNMYQSGIAMMPKQERLPLLEEPALEPKPITSANDNSLTEEEKFILQQITFAEAGYSQPDDAVIGIVNVIFNRKEHERFPDTITDVVFDNTNGVKQFSPTNNGKIYFSDWKDEKTYEYRQVESSDITEQVYDAVEKAVNGTNTVGKRKYFYVPKWCSEEELAKRANIRDAIQIGDVIFYGED